MNKQHRHHAGQIVTASGLSEKKRAWLRDHTHTAAQITGAPSNDKERAQGRQHWHDTSKVV